MASSSIARPCSSAIASVISLILFLLLYLISAMSAKGIRKSFWNGNFLITHMTKSLPSIPICSSPTN